MVESTSKFPLEIEKPGYVPDWIWNKVQKVDRHKLVKEIPHSEVILLAIPCSGDDEKGNLPGHLWRGSLTKYKWVDRPDLGYGYWGTKNKDVFGWRPENEIPEKMAIEGKEMTVIKSNSHGLCPQCE